MPNANKRVYYPSQTSWPAFGAAKGEGGDGAAILDLNYAGSLFRFDRQTYTDETTFNTAIGASKSGIQRVFGPYVDPSAPELFTNGDFASGTLSSWTTVLNGSSSASVVSGAASLASDGTTGTGSGGAGIAQAGATTIDKAYRILHDVITGQTIARLGGDTSVSTGVQTANQGAGLAYVNTFCAQYVSSYFYAARVSAGTTGVDNVSMKECLPFKGFSQSGGTAIIEGTTPAAASGTKVIFELGHRTSQGATDPFRRIHLAYNASGNLVIDARYRASSTVSFDLGAVAVNTAFKVKIGYKTNEFYAQLGDTGPIVSVLNQALPGFGAMYVGRSALTDKTWDGGIDRVRLFSGGGIDQFLPGNAIHTEGDSFMEGNTGVVLPNTLRTLMGRTVYNTGVGGATATNVRDRLVAASAGLRGKTTVIWDGSENPITTVGEVPGYVDLQATGIAALGHDRFIIIPACANSGESDMSVVNAVAAEIESRWPNNFLDWRDFLTLVAPGSYPADAMFVGLPGDTTHLSQAAMDLAAAAIKTFIDARGW